MAESRPAPKEFRADFRSMYVVATMVKPIFRVALGYPIGGVPDDGSPGAGLGLAQPGLKFAEGQSDGIEIGRLRR